MSGKLGEGGGGTRYKHEKKNMYACITQSRGTIAPLARTPGYTTIKENIIPLFLTHNRVPSLDKQFHGHTKDGF